MGQDARVMDRIVDQNAHDIFVTELRNAHAMEIQARELMKREFGRVGEYPEVKQKITAHLAETNEQLHRLEQCLKACGENTSTVKDAAYLVVADVMAMINAVGSDEILKNIFANNAFEHFEIAAYKSLIALSEPAGMRETRALLETSLKEEERMAEWIDGNVEKVTLAFVDHEARRQRDGSTEFGF